MGSLESPRKPPTTPGAGVATPEGLRFFNGSRRGNHSEFLRPLFRQPAFQFTLEDVFRGRRLSEDLMSLEELQQSNVDHVDIDVNVRSTGSQLRADNALLHDLKRVENRLNRLRESYLSGVDSLEEYRRMLDDILSHRQTLLNELQQIQKAKQSKPSVPRLTVANALLSDFFTAEQKNRLLKSFIQKIVFNRKKNHIDIYYRPIIPYKSHPKSSQNTIRRT